MTAVALTPVGEVAISLFAPPAAGDVFAGGLRFDAAGNLYVTTTLSATDTFVASRRISTLGQLVVASGTPPNRPYIFNGGLPSKANGDGAMIRQNNNTPAATDPYIGGGVRVGPLGGVYTRTP